MGGFGRTNWPRQRRIFSVAALPPVRARGMRLWPVPEPDCCELVPLPPPLSSLPAEMQNAVKKGVQIALRDMPPLNTSQAPNEHPPFKNTPLNKTVALVVGGDLALTGGAMAVIESALRGTTSASPPAGAELPIVAAQPQNSVTPQDLVPFLVFLSDNYERIHVSGVEAIPSSLDAYMMLAFTVIANGETIIDRGTIQDLRDLSIDLPPGSRLAFFVANRNESDAYLVYFTVFGWSYPCEGQGNFLSQTTLRQDGQWEEPTDPCVPPARRRNGVDCP